MSLSLPVTLCVCSHYRWNVLILPSPKMAPQETKPIGHKKCINADMYHKPSTAQYDHFLCHLCHKCSSTHVGGVDRYKHCTPKESPFQATQSTHSTISALMIESGTWCQGDGRKKHGNTTQHNTTQHNTTQHNTTQHNTTQHNTTRHDTTRHDTTRHNTTQHNTTQHNTTQHNTTQHNTTQHNKVSPQISPNSRTARKLHEVLPLRCRELSVTHGPKGLGRSLRPPQMISITIGPIECAPGACLLEHT